MQRTICLNKRVQLICTRKGHHEWIKIISIESKIKTLAALIKLQNRLQSRKDFLEGSNLAKLKILNYDGNGFFFPHQTQGKY